MIAIKKTNNYLTFSIDEIGTENLNSLIRDYFINDEDELSFTKAYSLNSKNSLEIQKLDKKSGSTLDTKEGQKLNESSDSLEKNELVEVCRSVVKEEEKKVVIKQKLSRMLKEEWKGMVDYIKKSLFIALKDNITNQSMSLNYMNNAKINNFNTTGSKSVNNKTKSFYNSTQNNNQKLRTSATFNC